MVFNESIKKAMDAAASLSAPRTAERYSFSDMSSVVPVGTLDDLRTLLLETGVILGHDKCDQADKHMRIVESVVLHESRHAYAAEVVGALATTFALNFFRTPEPKLPGESDFVTTAATITTFSSTTPRLFRAAVAAFPYDFSFGDLTNVKDLGYLGVDQVADEAMVYNMANGDVVPVPLSACAKLYGPQDNAGRRMYFS